MLLKKTKGRILKIAVFVFIFFTAVFLLPNFSQVTKAQVDTGIEYAEEIGLSDTDPRIIIARVIRVALGFLGIVALLLILYAGWLYMTSGGEPAKVDKAKKILSNAFIGLIIILSAFAIATFVINFLNRATSGTSVTRPPSTGVYGGVPSSGNRIIESHYPERGQTGVPRNTSIVVTFKEPMNVNQMIINDNGDNVINPDYILIYKNDDGTDPSTLVTDVLADASLDGRTFRFKPINYLGSPSEEIWYSVSFSSQLEKEDETSAFPGVVGALGYTWTFLVSTVIDLTPPRIVSIIPSPSSTEPRNVVVQINFNEAINPLASSGATGDGFENIVITNVTDPSLPEIVDGNFYISNQYRTVEFLTEILCGENSCGDDVFCLPATSTIEAFVKAAELVSVGEATALYDNDLFLGGFNGIVDMADNSLDGNSDGIAQGPENQTDQDGNPVGRPPYDRNSSDPDHRDNHGDDYRWDFNTTDEIILTAPSITSFSPNIDESDVVPNIIPRAAFDRLMMSSSMKKHAPSAATGSIALYPDTNENEVSFWLTKTDDMDSFPKTTTIEIRHSPFVGDAAYTPEFNFRLKDIYQNCYYPSSGTNGAITCTPNPPSEPYCCDGELSTSSCATIF